MNSCPVGTYRLIQIQGSTCETCSINCVSCVSANECTTCSNNTYLLHIQSNATVSGSTCVFTCPTGFYQKDRNCLACPSSCSACSFINNTISCTSCPSPTSLLVFICVTTCPKGYYQVLISSLSYCRYCSPQCAACVNDTTCTECTNKLSLTPSCLSTNCTTGQYLSDSQQCSPCNVACLTCYGGSSSECLSCNSSLVFYNGLCYVLCPFGMVKVGNTCLSCPIGCATCNITNNLTFCISCISPYLYSPLTAPKNCILSCS